MKKKWLTDSHDPGILKKLGRIMRLTFILIIGFGITVHAKSYSQTTHLDIRLNDQSIRDVFEYIEDNSEFVFLYKNEDFNQNKRVNVRMKDATINQILDKILEGEGVVYDVYERQIVIRKAEKLSSSRGEQQSRKVTGVVSDTSGDPLPGVTVVVPGTSIGTVTDANGVFNLSVPDNAQTLRFSFVGMEAQDVPIAGKTTFSVVMRSSEVGIDEVVVTALGIKREKKTLTYSTQDVDMEGLSTIKDVNLGNALAGKIAGVAITASTGATGVSGDPRIIIRGNRSIQNNNQPLIIVDGIPYGSTGGGLSSINPDDVESINVLKGPAASALYGSSANNGVIVVTTKRGKEGEPRIEVNSVSNFEFPYLYPEFQNEYAQGAGGIYQSNASFTSWGPKMEGQTVTNFNGEQIQLTPQPNNVKDVFSTGYNLTNSVSYSTGTEKSSTYFSYSNTTAQGLLKDNDLIRHNFNLRLTAELVDKLNMDFRITHFRQELKDKPEVGDNLFNPMFQLMKMPRSIRTSDIQDASYYNENFELKQITWAPRSTDNINPYWAMKGYENPSSSNRVSTFVSLRYDFTDYLYLQARGGMNISHSDSEEKIYWDTWASSLNAGTGDYYTSFSKSQNLNSDVLLAFNKELTKDFKLGLNVGAEIKDSQSRGQWSQAGGLTTENKFALDYAANLTSEDYEHRIQKQSVYGMGQLSFHEYLFLDFTARNDWSSTLPSPHSYFYPSVGLSGIITDMVDLPEAFSFIKLRASYAEVGNDASYSSILQTYSSDASGPVGMIYPQSTKVAENLIPENTKSWEIGADTKFLNNRLGVDFTWYKSNTYNQLVRITTSPSSGYSTGWINAGNIQNKGIEVMLYANPVETTNFSWDFSVNFARNKNKVIELTESLDRYEISSPNLSIGETWLIEGRPYGEIYTVGFERNDDGKIIVDATGKPKKMQDADLYLGNFNYDWTSGMTNTMYYKNWTMSFLIDLNYGGVRQSASEAWMVLTGTSKASLVGREEGIIVDGVKEDGSVNDIRINAEDYYRTIGGRD